MCPGYNTGDFNTCREKKSIKSRKSRKRNRVKVTRDKSQHYQNGYECRHYPTRRIFRNN